MLEGPSSRNDWKAGMTGKKGKPGMIEHCLNRQGRPNSIWEIFLLASHSLFIKENSVRQYIAEMNLFATHCLKKRKKENMVFSGKQHIQI
jgi:hypothetical protein